MYYRDYVAITERVSGEYFPYLIDDWSIRFQIRVESACLAVAQRNLQTLTSMGEEYRARLEEVRSRARMGSAADVDTDGDLFALAVYRGRDDFADSAKKHDSHSLENLVRVVCASPSDRWIEILELTKRHRLITWHRTTSQRAFQDPRSEVAGMLDADNGFDGAVWCTVAHGRTDSEVVCDSTSPVLRDLNGLSHYIAEMIRTSDGDEQRALLAQMTRHIAALSRSSILVLIDSIDGLEVNAATACAHLLNAGDSIRVIFRSGIELGLDGEVIVCEADALGAHYE